MAEGLDLSGVQADIFAYIVSSFPNLRVESGGVPTAESLPFVNGRLDPYIIVRFTDMMPSANEGSFMGPTHDGYYSMVDALCLAEDADTALDVANAVNLKMIGKKFENTGSMGKGWGGGRYAIFSEANRQPVAYVAGTTFRYSTNTKKVGSGSLI